MSDPVALSELLPLVQPGAPNAPAPRVLYALRAALDEWCRRTFAWRADIETMVTAQHHPLPLPMHTTVIRFGSARFGTNRLRLDPVAYETLTPTDLDPTTTGSPRWISQIEDDHACIVPFSTGILYLHAFVTPLTGAETTYDLVQIPSAVLNRAQTHIVNGALARLLIEGEADEVKPDLAAYHRSLFDAALDTNAGYGLRGQQAAPRRTEPHWF